MKIKLISLIIAIIFIFSGCSIGLKTVDQLIIPPKAYGENEGIQKAIDEKLETGYVLKPPATGSHTSAFILYDIDKDGTDEALAFYQPNKTSDQVNFIILKYFDNKWNYIQEVQGQGSDINMIEFGDIDGDGVNEIIVSWQMFNNKEKRVLSIYKYSSKNNSAKIKKIKTNINFTSMLVLDFDRNNVDELLLFTIDTAKSPVEANARLFTSYGNKLKQIGEVTLDPNVKSYKNFMIQDLPNTNSPVVFADGYKGENIMVTEIVYWDSESKTLKAPLYDASSSSTVLTSKGIRVNSRDVNGDGIVEIATQGALAGDVDENILVVNWNQLVDLQLNSVATSIINENDGYMLMLNEVAAGKDTAIYNNTKRELKIYEWDFENNVAGNEIYSIRAIKKSVWNTQQIVGYEIIGSNANLYYVAKINEVENNSQITLDEISENIRIYK